MEKITLQDFYNLFGCYLSKYRDSQILGISVINDEYVILLEDEAGVDFIYLPIPVYKDGMDKKFTDYANLRFNRKDEE